MKKTFRDYHLLKILESFDFAAAPMDVHLGQYFKKNKALGSKDRAHLAENAYAMIRWMGLIDHFCQDSHDWEERTHILKKLDPEKKLKDTTIPLHIRASFPKPLFSHLVKHYGEEKALSFCLASNTQAPTTVRTNVLKTSRQTLLSRWRDLYQVTPTQNSIWGIQFPKRINFQLLEEFQRGFFEVQDEASQLIANLLDATPGNHVLDYCAGSGGKTLAFAHKLQGTGQLYLHDVRKKILQAAKKRLKRAGIENGQILLPDAKHLGKLKNKMDWVLVDVPCTGTGTLRRNPDLKWKFSDEMLERIVQEQKEIFKQALSFLKPDGKIVYATCSVLPQENEEQVDYFQKKFGLILTRPPLKTFPTEGGMDGFFGAVLKKLEI